jgi:hypothetical protein
MKRRDWFKMAAGEVFAWKEEISGRPQLRLSELGTIPDAILGQIVPVVVAGVQIDLVPPYIVARIPGRQAIRERQIMRVGSPEHHAFNHFNGQNSLSTVTSQVAVELSWTVEESFQRIRNFFLTLAQQGVCVPRNPVGRSISEPAPKPYDEELGPRETTGAHADSNLVKRE